MKYIVKAGPCYLKAPLDEMENTENPFVDEKEKAHRFESYETANSNACFLAIRGCPVSIKVEQVEE